MHPDWRDHLALGQVTQKELGLLSKYDPFSAFAPYKVISFSPLSALLSDHPTLRCYFLLRVDQSVDLNWLRQTALQQPWAQEAHYVPLHTVAARPPVENRAEYWQVADMNLLDAWEMGVAAQPVPIAVIDNGFDYLHEDLQASVLLNTAEVPADGLDNDGNGYVDDYYGYDVGSADGDPMLGLEQNHGTYVAGVACATSNNGKGVVSAGYNCKLLCIKASRYNDPFIYNFLDGIEYALSRGVKIINLSFGSHTYSPVEAAMIEGYVNRGAIIVAAAGNGTTNQPFYPAAYNGVLAVGAMGNSQNIAFFSNYGTWVDVMAPGLNIYTTDPTTHSNYSNQMGTSVASPMVASLLGLMKGMNPTATNEELLNCLKTGSLAVDGYNPELAGQMGSGKVNAAAACNCIRPKQCAEDTVRVNFAGTGMQTSVGFSELGQPYVQAEQLLAQQIDLPQEITHLKGAEFMLVGNPATLGTGTVTFYLWDQHPLFSGPGQVLASWAVPVQEIRQNILNGQPTYVSWGQDVIVNRTVYIGIKLSDLAGKDLRIAASAQSAARNSTFVRYGSASWAVENTTYGQNFALGVFPIGISYDKAIKIQVVPQRVDEQTVNLSLQVNGTSAAASQFSWQFSDDGVLHQGSSVNRIVDNSELNTLELVVQDAICSRVYVVSQLLRGVADQNQDIAEAIQTYGVKEDVRVRIASPNEMAVEMEVLDLQGKVHYRTTLYKAQPVQNWTIPMSGLAAGVYMVRIKAGSLEHADKVILQP